MPWEPAGRRGAKLLRMPCPIRTALKHKDDDAARTLQTLRGKSVPEMLLRDAYRLKDRTEMALLDHQSKCRECQITGRVE